MVRTKEQGKELQQYDAFKATAKQASPSATPGEKGQFRAVTVACVGDCAFLMGSATFPKGCTHLKELKCALIPGSDGIFFFKPALELLHLR